MYRNVMVPVDGSTFSREAVLQGLRIASQTGAKLRLVRVAVAPPIPGALDGGIVQSPTSHATYSAELADLYTIAAECRAHSTVEVTASLERGPVVDALIGYARRHRVDLIVMRTHARGGMARVWFGSTADALIRESGIPVLIVRPPSVATALGRGFHYSRIIVALDGSALAEQALLPAVMLAQMDGATVTLLRVITEIRNPAPGTLMSPAGPAAETEVAEAQRYLDSLLPSSVSRTVRVTRRVVISSDVSSAILEMAEAGEADLVALATRGHGGLKRVASGSVADTVMRASAVSTLVVHPQQPLSLEPELAAAGGGYWESSPSFMANAT